MANLQISKLDNYIHIYDMDKKVLYSEHSFRVFVKKLTPTGDKYDIAFLRPDSTPAAFYSATIGQIFDAGGAPFSQPSWEAWYQLNTGDINAYKNTVKASISDPLGPQGCGDSVSTTLCVDQANVIILPGINSVVGVKDMGYYIGGLSKLLSLSIYNQDTANSILVSTDFGSSFVPVLPGVTINFDAGGLLNFFRPPQIWIDQNTATTYPLIIYTYIP